VGPLPDEERERKHAALDTRVAWVGDLFERIAVDTREERAVAVWRSPSDEGSANRLDLGSGWLRRAGAGRVLNPRGAVASDVPLPYPARSRGWLEAALLECARCHQVVERRSPAQRRCVEGRRSLELARSSDAVARDRAARRQARPSG
jgi:hypothetical protein